MTHPNKIDAYAYERRTMSESRSSAGDIRTHTVDRTGWPAGPWDDEPEDRIEWRDEATGIPCLMVRGRNHGAWCGYAAVPPGHAWHGAHYMDERLDDVDVHGGLAAQIARAS